MSAVRKDPSEPMSPQSIRGLVRRINQLGRHVRQGNITEMEARVLLDRRLHRDDADDEVIRRIEGDLDRILHSTPLEDVEIHYDQQHDLSIELSCTQCDGHGEHRRFSI